MGLGAGLPAAGAVSGSRLHARDLQEPGRETPRRRGRSQRGDSSCCSSSGPSDASLILDPYRREEK